MREKETFEYIRRKYQDMEETWRKVTRKHRMVICIGDEEEIFFSCKRNGSMIFHRTQLVRCATEYCHRKLYLKKFRKDKYMEKNWAGRGKGNFITIGASNHTDKERETNDYYATDPIAIDALLSGGAVLSHKVWECAAGQGHLSEKLKERGYDVRSTDLIDRGYGQGGVDFLQIDEIWDGDIITNPPYKYAKEFVEHAMNVIPDGRKVFMFLKLQFLEGKARGELFKKYPPKCVYVSRSRILCAKNGNFEEMKAGGGSAVAYAWYEFEKGYEGVSIIKWIN